MITKILKKYNAQRDYYYPDTKNDKDVCDINSPSVELEIKLQDKWEDHISPRWYGFALAPCPESWLHIVDEFLDYLVVLDPNFKIFQIKLKFGNCLLYLEYKIEDPELEEFVRLQIKELEWTLFDKKLIY